jgi:2-octaprenyl-6-methoxyphenol hydroxylase
MKAEVDILVLGGGPVGLAFAGALRGSGLDVLVADRGGEAAMPLRPVALAHGSRLFLDGMQAFAGLDATPITTIHVSQRGGFGRTVMRAEELGLPALGYVAELGAIGAHLATAIAPRTVRGDVTDWSGGPDRAQARIEGERGTETLRPRLLVLADGHGGVRAGLSQRDYGQSAVVALVRTSRAAPGVAYERFTPEGPIAMLPRGDGYALVWTVAPEDAARLLALEEPAFLERLQAAFGGRLGRMTSASRRAAYPLQLRFQRETVAAPRVLAIGNAAQTLHPVAGQGLNLGLRDAAELAAHVRAAPAGELGGEAFMRHAAAGRAVDRQAAIGVTDALVRVFGSDHPALTALRGAGLAALDGLPAARRFFARRMIFGTRALP